MFDDTTSTEEYSFDDTTLLALEELQDYLPDTSLNYQSARDYLSHDDD